MELEINNCERSCAAKLVLSTRASQQLSTNKSSRVTCCRRAVTRVIKLVDSVRESQNLKSSSLTTISLCCDKSEGLQRRLITVKLVWPSKYVVDEKCASSVEDLFY